MTKELTQEQQEHILEGMGLVEKFIINHFEMAQHVGRKLHDKHKVEMWSTCLDILKESLPQELLDYLNAVEKEMEEKVEVDTTGMLK